MKKLLLASCVLFLSNLAFASEEQVTLSVPGMSCPACPVTVRVSLEKVEGVKAVDVSYEDKTAKVTYDSSIASIADLTGATQKAGLTSVVVD